MISCIIADNPFQGVTVDTGSSATLVSCEVLRNAQHGVGVHSSSRVTLDDCLIADNGEEGIHGCDHSVVNARNTRIRNNRSIGVNNFYYTTGLYEDCTIESTSGWNVRVRGCADPTFVRCRMVGADTGVCVLHLGRGTFRDCEITGSAVDGVWIEDLAYPVLERCRVENSGKSGMVCLIRAHPTVTNCTMIDNAWSGAVLNGADVDIIQGVYADNGHFGVRAMNGSTGSVQSCDLTGNRYGPARVDRDSRVALSNSQVSQPKEPPPTPSDPVTISLDGDGDFSSISTALQLIPAGSTLALRPGTYTERLVIEVPVTIIGDGASDEVVLSCDRGVMVRSAGVTLRGLTLLSPEAEPGQTHNALQVLAAVGGITILDSGETASLPTLGVTRSEIAMVVENCRLQSATSAALFAEGNTVSVAIRGSEIFDSGGSGIYVRDGARLVTENCRVTGNAMPGVSIQSQAQAQVRDSVITSNGNHGVYAWEGGHAVIEGCDLRGNSPGPTFADQASRIDQQNNQL
jgi:hypothetical protein